MISTYAGNLRSIISALACCITASALSLQIRAQDVDLKFQHITTRHGLSQSTTTCILQDSKGFMWFGTQNGLNKYDGNSFTNYHNNQDDSSSILGSFIYKIIEDRDANLWIGTESGLNMYNRSSDNFIQYKGDLNDSLRLGAPEIRAIFEDHNGNLWIGTVGNGLDFFNRESKEIVHYHHDKDDPGSLSSNEICAIYEDGRNNLWLGSMTGDVYLFDWENESFIPIYYKDEKLSDDQIRNITGDSKGNIWISSYRDGLFMLDISREGEPEISHYTHNAADRYSISGNNILIVFEDSRERLWIGTENDGLNIFDRNNERFIQYKSDPYNDKGLNNNSIWSIYEDKTGNIWIGTFAGGINLLPNYGGYFDHYKNNPGKKNSLSNNIVTSFYEDSMGNFWIGTDGGGLNLFDRSKGTFISYNAENSGLGSNAVLSIFEDSRGNLWVGTWDGGLNLFDMKTRRFKKYTTENSNLCSNTSFSIIEDKEGIIWISSFLCGLSYFDRNSNSFVNYTPENSMISDDQIRLLLEDSYGNLLACGGVGLNVFNPETESFTVYKNVENTRESLSKGYVLCILEATDSTLWVGTTGGLNKFNRLQQNFTRYTVQNGLPSNVIKGMVEEGLGHLWISTNRGISRLDPETGIVENYDILDGLQDNEYYPGSYYKSLSGEIYFGGVNGFNIFNPDDVTDNPYIPPVVLTDFQIFNKSVEPGINSPLPVHINEAKTITLSYKETVFSFEFIALNYISNEKNQYSYKMDGFDPDWNNAGTRHIASYTNLDPGEYTFRVRGSNNDGVWNEEGTSIKIIITPPIWQTWWFRITALVIILLTIALIFYLRVRQIVHRNVILEKTVKERTKEINEKNATLQNQTEELKAQRDELDVSNSVKDKLFSIISHDLRSPFNTLKGFTELIKSRFDDYSDEEKKKMIGIISDSADQTYLLLDNLLNWSRSQRGSLRFNPRMTSIVSLIESKIDLLNFQAKNKNIRIEFDHAQEDMTLEIDPDLINVVIQNLLTNAIKFTKADGNIQVNANIENNHLILSVRDNGIGLSDDDIKKLFRQDTHFSSKGTGQEVGTGLGLLICKDFVELHQGKIWLESELDIGSAFFISLPLKRT